MRRHDLSDSYHVILSEYALLQYGYCISEGQERVAVFDLELFVDADYADKAIYFRSLYLW